MKSPILLSGLYLCIGLCLFACQRKNRSFPLKVTGIKKDGLLSIKYGNQNLLGYQYGEMLPPDSVRMAFKRSGFIHPLYSPKGEIMTWVQPPDHYHHYGIWNPWTHVEYRGDTIDFWNLGKEQATVRFAKFLAEEEGPLFYRLKVLHEHVIFGKNGQETIPLKEIQDLHIYRPEGEDHYIIDLEFDYQVQGKDPVKLLEYRYGGLGWRPPGSWTNKNSEVLTSQGFSRKEADGSLAKWFLVQGPLGEDYGGMILMSHPENYNHPEPIRVWPENDNKRGDLFVNFSPTKNTDWLLEPGKPYVLRYRLFVYQNRMDQDRAELLWKGFGE